MHGRLVYVMGPSGAGKDSILHALHRRLQGLPVVFARRYITRPASDGGEQHIPVNREQFEALSEQGYFSLQWDSHGLRYGISAQSDMLLEHGVSLIVNGSRAAFPEAVRRYPDILPVLISVPPEMLRARLTSRGRESGEALEERLQRAFMPIPDENAVTEWIRIDNSGTLETSADVLEKALRRSLHLN